MRAKKASKLTEVQHNNIVVLLARYSQECQSKNMNQNKYAELRNGITLRAVSLGYKTVTLFKETELAKAQLGYSVDPDEKSLCGSEEGDWQNTWLVIADEDETGDPIFVDLETEELSVYTAMHGERDWEPVLIAESFANFVLALEQIQALSKGRKNPVALQKNPLPEVEANAAIACITQCRTRFWEKLAHRTPRMSTRT